VPGVRAVREPAGELAGAWVVLYDDDCGFCKWLLAGLLRWDRAGRLRPLALQRPEADELLADLTPHARMASWHLISPAGERWSAGAALPLLLRLLPGGRGPAAVFARFPAATERGYRWVADHRAGLSRLVAARFKRRAIELVRRREHAR
jgi:predicted DCC family thiol-disulfide oxidoreductase YuxK